MFNKESDEWQAVKAECSKLRLDSLTVLLARNSVERDSDFYRGVVYAIDSISALERGPSPVVEIAAAPDY